MRPDEAKAIKGEITRQQQGFTTQSATVLSYRPYAGRGGIAVVLPDGPNAEGIAAVNTTGQDLAPNDRVMLDFDPPAGVYVRGVVTSPEVPASGLPPWGQLSGYSETIAAETAVEMNFCRFDGSADFADYFSYNAVGFTAVQSCIFEIGFQILWNVPTAFDYPRDGGGLPVSAFGLWSTVGTDTGSAEDQEFGFHWPQDSHIFPADVVNTNTNTNALATVANDYRDWEHTASAFVMFDAGQVAKLYVARSRNDGNHNGTDLGGFSVSASRLWIKPLVATTSSQQPIDDNFVTDSTLCG